MFCKRKAFTRQKASKTSKPFLSSKYEQLKERDVQRDTICSLVGRAGNIAGENSSVAGRGAPDQETQAPRREHHRSTKAQVKRALLCRPAPDHWGHGILVRQRHPSGPSQQRPGCLLRQIVNLNRAECTGARPLHGFIRYTSAFPAPRASKPRHGSAKAA